LPRERGGLAAQRLLQERGRISLCHRGCAARGIRSDCRRGLPAPGRRSPARHPLDEPELALDQWRRWAALKVEALNHALRNIPPARTRHHTCYGINMGPRIHDLELKHVVDIILSIRAGAYSFEAANPRHEHEWKVWETAKLPPDKCLIPGVISHSTVLVEHP